MRAHCLRFIVLTIGLVVLWGGRPTEAQNSLSPALVWVEKIQTSEENPLHWPVAVACGASQELVIAEARDPSLMVLRRRQELDEWEVAQSLPLPAAPSQVVFDGQRYIVALRRPGSLLAFAGEPLQQSSIDLPARVYPGKLAADNNGGLLVFDSAGSRILRLDSTGKVVREISDVEGVAGLALDDRGTISAAFIHPPRIKSWGAGQEAAGEWTLPGLGPEPAWPTGLANGTQGSLVISDRQGGRLILMDAQGQVVGWGAREGWDSGLLLRPADISRCPDQRFAVAELGNGRISIFQRLEDDGP